MVKLTNFNTNLKTGNFANIYKIAVVAELLLTITFYFNR